MSCTGRLEPGAFTISVGCTLRKLVGGVFGGMMVLALMAGAVLLWSSVESKFAAGGNSTAQGTPVLGMPSGLAPGRDGIVTVPVYLAPGGASVSSVLFSLDIAQQCLVFDPADGDGSGMPDAISVQAPSAFVISTAYDALDADGELDFILADYSPPYATLPAGDLVTIRLGVACWPSSGEALDIQLPFSSAPAPSFSAPSGSALQGGTVEGSVHVTNVAAVPTFAPTATSTPAPTETPPVPTPTIMATPTAGQPASPLPPPQEQNADQDEDGILSYEDGFYDWDADGRPNFLDPDDDGDGIATLLEGAADADGSGMPNYLDLDANNNGIPDAEEVGASPEDPQDENANGIWDFVEMPLYLPYIRRGEE